MTKRTSLLVLSVLIIVASCVPALADEVISITERGLVDTPAMLPRYTDTPWEIDFRDNPALLSLDSPYRLILDRYYTGGNRHLSMDSNGRTGGFNFGGVVVLSPGNTVVRREMDYYAHGLSGDAGFALKLAEGTNLAGLFTYRWDHLSGSGEFANESQAEISLLGIVFPLRSSFAGTTEERLDAHTFGASLLLSREVGKDLTLGAGLKYTYRTETSELDESGFGNLFFGIDIPENADVSKDLTLRTHEIAPVIGVRYQPTEAISLDGSLEVGFAFGSVNKDSSLFDDQLPPPSYSEDLDSNNLFGWRIGGSLRPELSLTDSLSVPIVLSASYRDITWSVDGASTGLFAPRIYLDVFYGQGTIEYESNVTEWDLTAGAGLKYRTDRGAVSGLVSYIHTSLRDAYDQENFDTLFGIGLTALGTRDTEARDVLSLALTFEREFSENITADVGLRYDVGWAQRDYRLTYSSLYESPGTPAELIIDTDGRDTYQDLTLTASLTMRPVDRLDLSFGGMVRAPLDPLDYELEGDATGLENGYPSLAGFQTFYSGPFTRDSDTTGWDWGGWLYLTYEFGAAPAVPPRAPEEPKVSPIITPMSMR